MGLTYPLGFLKRWIPVENWQDTLEWIDKVNWAFWTPLGIFDGFDENEVIPYQLLAVQSVIGILFSLALLIGLA